MSAAHKITARGYPVTVRAYITDDGEIHKGRLQIHPNNLQMNARNARGEVYRAAFDFSHDAQRLLEALEARND